MTTWKYEAFESHLEGRAGITELEQSIAKKMEELGVQAEYAKIAMSNIVGGIARAVIYYPERVLSVAPIHKLSGWLKGDVNLIADSADTTCYHEVMYQGIAELLSSLSDAQAVRSQIAATACKNGYATVTVWYPSEVA
jgi:hypothetical protein